MASKMTVEPAMYGGYGRKAGLYGGLHGIQFNAKCPPDVQPNTRVIAVCGIPGSRAAPQDDGWFFSDFFLFWQMLGNNRHSHLPNTLWLSSCSPRELVMKHKRYLHGPPNGITGDRRVVMDADMLPDNELAAGFRVCPEKELLERFLATLKSEIKEAKTKGQPVLVFVFGHGEGRHGIFIGCQNGDKKYTINKDRLMSVLNPEVQTTMVLTSCFSGGWVIMPNIANDQNVFIEKPAFNLSILTAAGARNESLSHEASESLGRQHGGSLFASLLIDSCMIASDTEKTKLIRVDESDETVEDADELMNTMADLTKIIIDQSKKRCGTLWDIHNFSFAAQDDLWELSLWKRTGLPLLKYGDIWRSLPVATGQAQLYPGQVLTGSIQSKDLRALNNQVRVQAIIYMSEKPGLDNAGGNTYCHPGFKRLIRGELISDFDELYRLQSILEYRAVQIELARSYCKKLGIEIPEGREPKDFDQTEWQLGLERQSRAGITSATETFRRYLTARGVAIGLGLFERPIIEAGFGYSKPLVYLPAMIAESSIPEDQIKTRLEDVLQSILREAQQAAQSPMGQEILCQPEIKSRRQRIYKSVKTLRDRMRSLSPQKRTPIPADER